MAVTRDTRPEQDLEQTKIRTEARVLRRLLKGAAVLDGRGKHEKTEVLPLIIPRSWVRSHRPYSCTTSVEPDNVSGALSVPTSYFR